MTIKTLISTVALAVCLFFGFWAFAYQGYQEDAGSKPLETWPYGAAFYTAAVVIILAIIRRKRPTLSGRAFIFTALAVALMGLLAALLSLDAGGNSFEF